MNFKSFKIICVIFFLRDVVMVNVNSHSGIYDLSGKREQEIFIYDFEGDDPLQDFEKTIFSVRDSLQIVQAEWNIVKLGNAAHFGMCKRARLKDLYMEANKPGWFSSKTIPLMTNKIIEVSKKTKTHLSISKLVTRLVC